MIIKLIKYLILLVFGYTILLTFYTGVGVPIEGIHKFVIDNKILQMIENRDSAIYDYHKYFQQYTIKKVRWKSLVS